MADERFTEAIRNKELMTAFLSSEGWEMVDAVLSERESILLAEFTDETKDYSDAKLREFRIALKLVRTIRMTPGTILAVAEETLAEYTEDEDEEQQPEMEQDDGEEERDSFGP